MTLATRLLAERVADNDKRYAGDAYSKVSLSRLRALSISGLRAESDALHEQNRLALLEKITWTSKRSLLSTLALLAYPLAFAGLVGGVTTGSALGVAVGVVAAGYAIWHYNYEKRLAFAKDLRDKDIQAVKWVLIEKGDEMTTRMAGLPFLHPTDSMP